MKIQLAALALGLSGLAACGNSKTTTATPSLGQGRVAASLQTQATVSTDAAARLDGLEIHGTLTVTDVDNNVVGQPRAISTTGGAFNAFGPCQDTGDGFDTHVTLSDITATGIGDYKIFSMPKAVTAAVDCKASADAAVSLVVRIILFKEGTVGSVDSTISIKDHEFIINGKGECQADFQQYLRFLSLSVDGQPAKNLAFAFGLAGATADGKQVTLGRGDFQKRLAAITDYQTISDSIGFASLRLGYVAGFQGDDFERLTVSASARMYSPGKIDAKADVLGFAGYADTLSTEQSVTLGRPREGQFDCSVTEVKPVLVKGYQGYGTAATGEAATVSLELKEDRVEARQTIWGRSEKAALAVGFIADKVDAIAFDPKFQPLGFCGATSALLGLRDGFFERQEIVKFGDGYAYSAIAAAASSLRASDGRAPDGDALAQCLSTLN